MQEISDFDTDNLMDKMRILWKKKYLDKLQQSET